MRKSWKGSARRSLNRRTNEGGLNDERRIHDFVVFGCYLVSYGDEGGAVEYEAIGGRVARLF